MSSTAVDNSNERHSGQYYTHQIRLIKKKNVGNTDGGNILWLSLNQEIIFLISLLFVHLNLTTFIEPLVLP